MAPKNTNVPIYGEVSDELLFKLMFSWLVDCDNISIKPINKNDSKTN